jgi:hypothetical protein
LIRKPCSQAHATLTVVVSSLVPFCQGAGRHPRQPLASLCHQISSNQWSMAQLSTDDFICRVRTPYAPSIGQFPIQRDPSSGTLFGMRSRIPDHVFRIARGGYLFDFAAFSTRSIIQPRGILASQPARRFLLVGDDGFQARLSLRYFDQNPLASKFCVIRRRVSGTNHRHHSTVQVRPGSGCDH